MATIKATRDAIKALPGMTALYNDGEWRVTVNLYRLSERYPDKDTKWCEKKQEDMAYYTDDADDALSTARDMSRRWMAEVDAVDGLINAVAAEGGFFHNRYMAVSIENTRNAAFADTGREREVARMLEAAADKMDDWWTLGGDQQHPLRDVNGNTVGHLELTAQHPVDWWRGEFSLLVTCKEDAEDPAHEAAQHLREAAMLVARGAGELSIFDGNGNRVGTGELKTLPSLERDGVIDMKAALSEGKVYLAEDGFSGLAEGEYPRRRPVMIRDRCQRRMTRPICSRECWGRKRPRNGGSSSASPTGTARSQTK